MASWLGVVMMMTTIPRVLLMSIGGVVADRFKRSSVLFASNGLRGLFIILMVLLLKEQHLSILYLCGFALSYGVLDAFFWPSSNSFVPQIMQKHQITRANSMLQTTNQFSLMIGPALAGFVMRFGSFAASFTCAAVLLIVGAAAILMMKESNRQTHVNTPRETFVNQFREGLQYVKTFPYLITVMGTSIVVNLFLVGPMNVGLSVLVNNVLKGNVLSLSYLESTLAVGMFIGAIVTGIMNFKRKRGVISLTLVGVLGITSALLSCMTTLWYGLVIIALSGFCLGVSNIVGPSLTQELVNSKMMGRVQSLMSTASMGFTPISFGVVSVLLSAGISIQAIMMASCAMMSLFCFIVLWRVKVVWAVD